MNLGLTPLSATEIATPTTNALDTLKMPANLFNAVRSGTFIVINKRSNECKI